MQQLVNPSLTIARWILQLEEYDFEIEYRESKRNGNIDGMSHLLIKGNTCMQILESCVTLNEVREAQQNNTEIAEIIEAVKAGSWTIENDSILRKHFRTIKELFVDDNILYRQINDERIQVIFLPSLHKDFIQLVHSSATGGHKGVARTT